MDATLQFADRGGQGATKLQCLRRDTNRRHPLLISSPLIRKLLKLICKIENPQECPMKSEPERRFVDDYPEPEYENCFQSARNPNTRVAAKHQTLDTHEPISGTETPRYKYNGMPLLKLTPQFSKTIAYNQLDPNHLLPFSLSKWRQQNSNMKTILAMLLSIKQCTKDHLWQLEGLVQ